MQVIVRMAADIVTPIFQFFYQFLAASDISSKNEKAGLCIQILKQTDQRACHVVAWTIVKGQDNSAVFAAGLSEPGDFAFFPKVRQYQPKQEEPRSERRKIYDDRCKQTQNYFKSALAVT